MAPPLHSPSRHNGRSAIFGRLLAGCCFLAAALLVWTQQNEYENNEHRIGGPNSWRTQQNDHGKEAQRTHLFHKRQKPGVQPFVCKIGQLELKLPQAPDIIIAGAAKSGTTTLANWLLEHPKVLPTKKLECHFLTAGIHPHEVDILLNSENNQTSREDLVCELRKRYLHQWPDLSQAINDGFDKSLSTERFFTFDKVRQKSCLYWKPVVSCH